MNIPQNKPTFRAPASTGQTLGSESFRGKVPLAMIFLPDAAASTEALAMYNTAHKEMGSRRVQLLAVVPETASDARQMSERARTTFPLLADPSGSIFREFGAFDCDDEPIACSVIIDRTGTVASKTEGVVSPSEMTAQLDDLEGSRRFEMAVNR